jgi:hypothetical protein
MELRLVDNNLVCDWGVIDNPDPCRGEVCPLMIITRDLADEIARGRYVHADLGGRHFVWELFEAHWWDGKGTPVYLGAWPD